MNLLVLLPLSAALTMLRVCSVACQFRVMPRYKVRSLGDRVAYDDQIVLVAVKRELRLHVSASTFPGTEELGHEVTASQVHSHPSH
jgi:hypothetical protein